MNDRELNECLKSAVPPGRSDAARQEFVESVLLRIRRGEGLSPTATRERARPRVGVWAFATIALILVTLLVVLRGQKVSTRPPPSLSAPAALWRELARTFPDTLLAVIMENGDARLVLAERRSAQGDPICVRLLGAKRPCTVIAISGEPVEASGLRFEVLADAGGQVWLIGENAVWSSAEPSRPFAHLTVEASRLAGVL